MRMVDGETEPIACPCSIAASLNVTVVSDPALTVGAPGVATWPVLVVVYSMWRIAAFAAPFSKA